MEGGVKIACKIVRHRPSLLNRKCLLKSGCSDTKLELFYSFQQIVTGTRPAFCFFFFEKLRSMFNEVPYDAKCTASNDWMMIMIMK